MYQGLKMRKNTTQYEKLNDTQVAGMKNARVRMVGNEVRRLDRSWIMQAT